MGRNRYTAPTDEETTLEELSKGWPKRLSHPLHTQHPLLKSLRPVYNCDSCHTIGHDWSFHCPTCDFDLHHDCALEAQLVEMAKPWPRTLDHRLHRIHPLVKTRLDTFWCDSCGEKGSWWCFYCERCDFSLHLQCAFGFETARTIDADQKQPPERLTIEIVRTAMESYWCSKCAEEGKGTCYRCEDCDVDLHPRCAAKGNQWPRSIVHKLHEHELVKSKSNRYYCDKCWTEGRGCYLGCVDCDFGLHPRCATEVELEGTGSWVDQMAHGRRKEEVLQQVQLQQEPEQRQQVVGGDVQEEEVDGDHRVAYDQRELLLKRVEEEATQRMQMESTISQLEQIRLYAEALNMITVDGAAAVAEMADGVPRTRRDSPYGFGYRYY